MIVRSTRGSGGPTAWGSRASTPRTLECAVDGGVSDASEVRFGIRQVTSELTRARASAVQDQRPADPDPRRRLGLGHAAAADHDASGCDAEMRYVREMGLNTIRLEGKLETDEFFDLADEQGILVMAGWCCCDQWEMWDKWDARGLRASAPQSLRDQLLRLRNHPSVFVWLNGSDKPPTRRRRAQVPRRSKTARVESPDALERGGARRAGQRPERREDARAVRVRAAVVLAARHEERRRLRLRHRDQPGRGGAARSRACERCCRRSTSGRSTTSGTSTPAAASSRRSTRSRRRSKRATARPPDAADYARKAQALTYEGERAMFEAYARNKYTSTGVIQWMLNNAWPSTDLAPLRLLPAPGRRLLRHEEGVRAGARAVLVRRSLDRASSTTRQDAVRGLQVSASVLDFGLTTRFSRAGPRRPAGRRASCAPSRVPEVDGLTTTYFLRLSAATTPAEVVEHELLLAVDAGGSARLVQDRVVLHPDHAARGSDGARATADDDHRGSIGATGRPRGASRSRTPARRWRFRCA